MSTIGPEQGFAFFCTHDATIAEVIRDELGLSGRIQRGRSLFTLVDQGSVPKALNFLLEIKSRGAAFDWQLSVPVAGTLDVLNFAGAVADDKLLIVAAKTSDGLKQIVEELVKIGNEQINSLRSVLKDQAELAKKTAQRESALYDELSRLNNELTNLQRELVKKNIQLEQLNEEKNRFLGIAAHDLRNPLNAIQLYSEFLLEEVAGLLNPEHQEFIEIIHSSSQFMLQLVNDLLDVAKIESGKLYLEVEPTDLVELIKRNLVINRAMAAKKEISLGFQYDTDIPELMIDKAKMEQVLNNLITNAVKFSAPGSSVEVGLTKSQRAVILSVRDKGQGIPKKDLEKLFTPFQRTSVRPTAGEQSTGLGLAIVRKIVAGHGGKVWVESEVGKGSTFYVSLPLGTDEG